MTTATLTRPLTALAFLLDNVEGADAAEALARQLGEHHVARTALGGLRRLSGSALRAVDGEIAAVAAGLLDLGLGDNLVSAWRKYAAMTSAAERTLAAAGSEMVLLATHRVTWTREPHIDLLVDGRKITTFEFQLEVVFDLHGVVAVVRRGDLVALRGGECLITATLTLEGQTLAQRHARTHLALLVPLDPPASLLGNPTTADAPLRQRGALTR
jgi:hypothetical protein